MPCIDCAHLDLKAVPEMARQGFGTCDRKRHLFLGIKRAPGCEQFKQADAAVVARRVEWVEKGESK